ncbi:MAG: gamma-glutamyltransferase [Planctomycetes bacterium]|nr:gamma-glutamyltransferase [Planctomycetota bacterium]
MRSGEKATSLRYTLMDLARTRADVISLGRGDPDLHTHPDIVEGAIANLTASGADELHPREHRLGLGRLRRGIARRLSVEKGIEVDPESEIVITNGGQEGLFLAMLALVDPSSNGLGADAVVLVYVADEKKVYSINAEGTAPALATIDWYREHNDGKIPRSDGLLSASMPAVIDAWYVMLDRWGTMSFGSSGRVPWY